MTTPPLRPTVAIIGAGASGLMAADFLSRKNVTVILFDRMPSMGRKLLMAGRGGLNLTHTEETEAFLGRYREAKDWMRPYHEGFSPDDLRAWCEGLGEPTFVGTSGRVFPQSFKASPLLRALLARLEQRGVTRLTRHEWNGFSADDGLKFITPEGEITWSKPDATLLAMGGGSWAKLGANGAWREKLLSAGVDVAPFQPANNGFRVTWSPLFKERYAGTPLKRMRASIEETSAFGELMITESGLEGGAIYALSAELRRAARGGEAPELTLDLRPDLSVEALAKRLEAQAPKASLSNRLRKGAGLSPVAISLLWETGLKQASPSNSMDLAQRIKAAKLRVEGPEPIARAISTAGGVSLHEVTERLMLKKRPGVFVAGEMLDWEAPTGGYLLQACFSTATAASEAICDWVRQHGAIL